MVSWLVVVLDVCVRISLRRLECKSANLIMLGGVSFSFFRVWGQALSPPTSGSTSVKIIPGGFVSLYHVASGCVCFVVVCDSRV
jgi:hypothetical protein